MASARFCPDIKTMLPGPRGVYALNVTPSTAEFARSDGANATVIVNVTERLPLVAITWTVPGVAGIAKTLVAIPAELLRAFTVLREPPPPATANVTVIPGSGA